MDAHRWSTSMIARFQTLAESGPYYSVTVMLPAVDGL